MEQRSNEEASGLDEKLSPPLPNEVEKEAFISRVRPTLDPALTREQEMECMRVTNVLRRLEYKWHSSDCDRDLDFVACSICFICCADVAAQQEAMMEAYEQYLSEETLHRMEEANPRMTNPTGSLNEDEKKTSPPLLTREQSIDDELYKVARALHFMRFNHHSEDCRLRRGVFCGCGICCDQFSAYQQTMKEQYANVLKSRVE
jgi:hypothetical protein